MKNKQKNKKVKSVDQMTIARMVANKTGINLSTVQEIIEQEQKYTMDFVKRNYKVIKKNYITITPTSLKAKKFQSPLNGKEYNLPDRTGINIKAGYGFKSYVSGPTKKMPNKICRFVDGNNILNYDSQILTESH